MTKDKKLTKQQKAIIERIKNGATLWFEFDDGKRTFFMDDGRVFSRKVINNLISKGFLKEKSDAMFGVGQSYEVNHERTF